MKNRSIKNWLIDALLFSGFIFAFFLDFTGLSFHEWLGLGVAVLAGYHLLLHWKWVVSVTKRLFGKTSNQARQYYFLDVFILLGFLVFSITGLVISTWFNFSLVNYPAWVDVHVYSSILTLAFVVLKIALHWRWIVFTAKKIFFIECPAAQLPKPQPAKNTAHLNRREFISLMSVVGIASFFAVKSIFEPEDYPAGVQSETSEFSDKIVEKGSDDLQLPEGSQSISESLIIETAAPEPSPAAQQPTAAPIPQVSSQTTCTIQCRKNCAAPGRCRKFVDVNSNNLCDLAECV